MNVRQRLGALAFALLLIPGLAGTSGAAPIVTIVPATQDAANGSPVFADIVVSDLTEPLGGFQLLLNFDESILQGVGYAIGTELGFGLDDSVDFAAGGGPLDLFFTSLEDSGVLAGLQGTGFTLARVEFLAVGPGRSPLTLSSVVLATAAEPSADIFPAVRNGSVCVDGPCTVPEPGLLALLGAGLAGFAVRRRRHDA